MKYISIQDRIIEQLPATLEDISVGFVTENTIKHALTVLMDRGLVKIDDKKKEVSYVLVD